MNLASLVTLTAPGSTLTTVEVINGQLIIYFDHKKKVDQETGHVNMVFNYAYVKSPPISLDFLIV
jgi:hypothetical protein